MKKFKNDEWEKEDRAIHSPRFLQKKDSKRYAIQTLGYLKTLWGSREASVVMWERGIKQAEEAKIWIALERKNLDELIQEEIGVTVGESLDVIERRQEAVKTYKDSKLAIRYNEETQKGDGAPIGNQNAKKDKEEETTVNNVDSCFVRPRGNSKQRAIRKLRKEERFDLLGKVERDELSAHAAMIEAGYRKRTITIPIEVESVLRILREYFTEEQREEIRECLT